MSKKTMNGFVVQDEDIICFAKMLGSLKPENKEGEEYRLWKSITGASAILFEDLFTYLEFMKIVEE